MKNPNKLALLGGRPLLTKPFPPYNSLGPEETRAVKAVMQRRILSDFIGQAGPKFLGGHYVQKLEQLMTKKFKVKYAVSFNSASTALQAAVTSLGIGPGDEVITSPFTMTATPSAVLLNNAIPVFADSDPDNYCLDYRSVGRNITNRTKAIMTVNLFGGSSDFSKLLTLAKRHKLPLIEDNAQSIGSKYRGKFLGTVGDIGIFSFNVHKTLQCGEGGVLVTNNKKLAWRARLVRNHGEVVVDGLVKKEQYEALIGNNFRLSELQAAIAIEQLKKIAKLNQPRVALANYLTSELKKYLWLEPVKVLPKTTHVYYIYPFKFFSKKLGISRDLFARAMTAEGFPVHQGYTKPLYLIPMYQRKRMFPHSQFPFVSREYPSRVSYRKGICPVVERLYEKELLYTTICYPPRTKKDIDLFIAAIDKIVANLDGLKKYGQKKH